MSEIITTPTGQARRSVRQMRNPVMIRELRSRMRGRRAFSVLTVYLVLMSSFILLVYLAYSTAVSNPFGPSSRQAGKAVFAAVLAAQLFLVIFIGPAFTAAAITGEKERRTYDLLRTTLLSARSLVSGKLFSALSYVLLLILVSIPFQSIAFLLGGIAPIEIILSQILIILSALTFALIGLFFSITMRSTIAASVITFGTAIFLTIGTPVLVGLVASLFGTFFFGVSSPPWPFEGLLIYLGLALAATNLPATLIVSDFFLVEQDALFFYTELIDGHSVLLFSPWILFLALYTLLAILLYWASVRQVRKVARR